MEVKYYSGFRACVAHHPNGLFQIGSKKKSIAEWIACCFIVLERMHYRHSVINEIYLILQEINKNG